MRRKLGFYVFVPVIVALGVLVFGSAVAAADAKGKKKTLRLVGNDFQTEFLDLGAPDFSRGDEFVISDVLLRRGREVGVSGAVCTVTEAVPPYDVLTLHCVGTLSLRGGQITTQGLVELQGPDDPGPFTLAITGGTGRYRGAAGELRLRNPTPTTAVYRLRFVTVKKRHR